MDKLYIIIPAYNEEANIEKVIEQWYPIAETHNGQMVIIDDGSKDRTYEILRQKEKTHPLLTAEDTAPQFCMDIVMLWSIMRTIFFRQIRMGRRCRKSLRCFGQIESGMIWSSDREETGRTDLTDW